MLNDPREQRSMVEINYLNLVIKLESLSFHRHQRIYVLILPITTIANQDNEQLQRTSNFITQCRYTVGKIRKLS